MKSTRSRILQESIIRNDFFVDKIMDVNAADIETVLMSTFQIYKSRLGGV